MFIKKIIPEFQETIEDLGITTAQGSQKKWISRIKSGMEMVAIGPTNSGKTTAYIIALIPVTVVAFYHFAQFEFNPITISGIFKPFFYSHTMYGAVMAFLAAIALGNFPHRSFWKWVFVV